MPRFYAQIEVLVDAEGELEAADAMNGLLTECGKKEGVITNWQYRVTTRDKELPRWLIEVPSSLDFAE
jgi:hypothetical protein